VRRANATSISVFARLVKALLVKAFMTRRELSGDRAWPEAIFALLKAEDPLSDEPIPGNSLGKFIE
jgi:hypothetical protein